MSSTATKSVSKGTSLRKSREDAQNPEQKTDSIVTKTLRMANTLEKYPKPAR
ncbi:hypothetical protein [Dyadobacter jiangsuensis]